MPRKAPGTPSAKRARRRPRDLESPVLRTATAAVRLIPGLTCWRNNTGKLRNPKGVPIAFGVKGSADLSGIVAPEGWRFELECKAPGEVLTPYQEAWRDMILQSGGLWFFCDYLDPMRLVAEVQRELTRRRLRQ